MVTLFVKVITLKLAYLLRPHLNNIHFTNFHSEIVNIGNKNHFPFEFFIFPRRKLRFA